MERSVNKFPAFFRRHEDAKELGRLHQDLARIRPLEFEQIQLLLCDGQSSTIGDMTSISF